MPVLRSISPKKNSLLLFKFIVTFLALFFFICCGPTLIWNVPADDLPGVIASGDTSYLRNLDASEIKLEEILKNGPGSAYFHAFLAREIGREELFAPLLDVEWRNGDAPWRAIAGEQLCRYYIETGDYAQAESVAAGLLEGEEKAAYKALYIEALYRQQRDEEVIEKLDAFDFYGAGELDELVVYELELFKAVSSARLGKPSWKKMLLDLFRYQPPSSLHYRVLRFIENNFADAFSPEETAFIQAVVAVADSRYADAVPVFDSLLSQARYDYLTEAAIHAAYTAFRFSGQSRRGALLFENLISNTSVNLAIHIQYSLHEKTGLLNYYAANFGGAAEYIEKAMDIAVDEPQVERMRWYLLKINFIRSLDKAVDMLPSVVQSYADPDYYTDVLDDILTSLVGLERWDDLFEFHDYSRGFVSPGIRARTAYLCSAAFREELIEPGYPGGGRRAAEVLLGEATVDGVRYYSLLASALLQVFPGILNIVEETIENETEPATEEIIAEGFIYYGLPAYAFELVRKNPASVSDQTLLDLSCALAKAGDVYNSIRTTDLLRARPSYQQTREALELAYPRPFRSDIEAAARRDDLPPYLLFALIREESYFKRDIVSHSGAVGLSQLMPATAADTAKRMGIELPPLTDPAGNISIGSYYFSQMLRRFGVPSNAVFAYNAGPTRMRTWRREYPGFSEDLLLEALPIEETQDHGRKVFSSAVMYGYLYYGVSASEVADYYFQLTKKDEYESD